jgi:hypothetical protein
MPFNLLIKYNHLLELSTLNDHVRRISLRGVFDRDISNHPHLNFRGKNIVPTKQDGQIPLDTLFTHLTCKLNNPVERKRIFDFQRSLRLHWVKEHIEETVSSNLLVFSVREQDGNRTYIYNRDEKYVVVLEPKKNNYYFLLSAYLIEGKDEKRDKMERKYKRRLPEVL